MLVPTKQTLEIEQLKKENGASATSLSSSIGCQTEDEEASPEREPIDDHYIGPKNLVFTKDGSTIVKKNSITHFVKDINREAKTRGRLNSISGNPNDEKPMPEARVLVLYTGGTVGMKCKNNGVYEPEAHYLPLAIRDIPPLNDKEYVEQYYGDHQVQPYCLPPVRHTQKRVVYWVVEYEPLLDSSDMTFDDWIRIAKDIRKSYHEYDGFVVLHGTDTLAYTASALSFMMENLGKPVVLTGAQIPVAEVSEIF
jgi:L-asparaginase/Glu-tRNA(Gln) amidotransferase subunit D